MAFEYNIVRGFREDKEKTYNEGIKAGISKGKLTGAIESIIELLNDYGPLPKELLNRLNSETDFQVLKSWLKLASKTTSVQEFIDKM